MSLQFGSVCSGIEAASVAWHPLGWRAAWLSEIEPFPCAVLAHHYPDVPNLGDMTTLPERILSGEIEAPDLFCGGTPCQAFSVAGNRRSLDDARGNLSLTFCEIANAIDSARAVLGERPCIVFWENVPGVLNTKDNAFGCFLAGLAGESVPLEPPGGKWTDAGCVLGPARAVAWRVFDAQYFGLAQRRRRVFVVASARNGFDPAAILFEFDGVRRDSAPSREKGQGTAADVAGGAGDGMWWDGGQVSQTLDAVLSKGQTMPEKNRFPAVLQPVCAEISPTVTNGQPFSRTGNERVECEALVSYAIQAGALRENPSSGPDGIGVQENHAYTLEARAEVQCVATYCIPGNWMGRAPENGGNATTPMDNISPCLTGADKHGAVSVGGNIAHTLRGEGFDASEDGTGRGQPIVAIEAPPHAFKIRGGCEGGGKGYLGQDEQAFTITTGHDQQVAVPVTIPFDTTQTTSPVNYSKPQDGDPCHPLCATAHVPAIATKYAVRRLTPTECERLQGFPDGYTNIPWRNRYECLECGEKFTDKHATGIRTLAPAECPKCGEESNIVPDCPDGPRYKALGNSWAVPVVRWIGQRIDAAVRAATDDIPW